MTKIIIVDYSFGIVIVIIRLSKFTLTDLLNSFIPCLKQLHAIFLCKNKKTENLKLLFLKNFYCFSHYHKCKRYIGLVSLNKKSTNMQLYA